MYSTRTQNVHWTSASGSPILTSFSEGDPRVISLGADRIERFYGRLVPSRGI